MTPSAESLLSPEPEPVPTAPETVQFTDDYSAPSAASQRWVQWADDVDWVFQNHSSALKKTSPGMTPARWGIYQYAKKNMDQFMGQLVPKAMTVLEKAHAKNGDADAVVVEEKRTIAEMRSILVAAIAESQGALSNE